MKDFQLQLTALFESWAGERAETMTRLAQAGSDRRYFRISAPNHTAIGTYNADIKENRAFFAFSKHFHAKGLPVPAIYAISEDEYLYVQEDLGDIQLFSLLPKADEPFSPELLEIFKKTVAQLARLQILGHEGLDYSVCYPRAAFDKQSMLWDLNYFKHYFLKLAKIPFDEQLLENDFQKFTDYLLLADRDYFLFRDFQSRNVMIKNGEPYFVDYQGGRSGALQYDLASLLFQAKGNIPAKIQNEVIEHYLTVAETLTTIDRRFFMEQFYGYVLIRCLQALGAYGFRGLYERREHFITSIPFAIKQMDKVLKLLKMPVKLPELMQCLKLISACRDFDGFDAKKYSDSPLTVHVTSFSYLKMGYPKDNTGTGGGFAFDCRYLHNPGRYQEYKHLTGRDEQVILFLKQNSGIDAFMENIFGIVDKAVENYLERGFHHLTVNFGCTGGQHRSVYSADALTKHLVAKYGVKVDLQHLEQERKGWKN
jgi:aminoglycoside/choline kinase family phosphotransferase